MNKKISHFQESEGSLLRSQKYIADLEPVECNPYLKPNLLRSILKLSSHLCLGFSSGLFALRLFDQTMYAFLIYATCLIPGYPP